MLIEEKEYPNASKYNSIVLVRSWIFWRIFPKTYISVEQPKTVEQPQTEEGDKQCSILKDFEFM